MAAAASSSSDTSGTNDHVLRPFTRMQYHRGMTSSLFTSIALRDLALPNRLVVSPMCQYSAVNGCATDWHSLHWGQLLLSGAGMFTIEATAVTDEGRISPGDLGLYDDACEAAVADRLARMRAQVP